MQTTTITVRENPCTVRFYIDMNERGKFIVIDDLLIAGVHAHGLLDIPQFDADVHEELHKHIGMFGIGGE